MKQASRLAGRVFGKLTVVNVVPHKSGGTRQRALCKCACGNYLWVEASNLRAGRTKSCGCYRSAAIAAENLKHGHAKRARCSPEYRAWAGIKTRCLNARSKSFAQYGARGIGVCPAWLDSFEAFLADVGPRPSSAYSIERIDNDGDYSPSNCRWATSTEQQGNKRSTRRITFNGVTLPLSTWAKRLGIKRTTLERRINAGWSIEDAFQVKPRRIGRWGHLAHLRSLT